MTIRKTLISAALSLVVAAAAAGIAGISASATIYTAEEIFSFRNIAGYSTQALDSANRPALAVNTGSGGEIVVNGELSGDFSWEIGSENISAYALVFTDVDNGDMLTVEVRAAGTKLVVSAEYTSEEDTVVLSSVTAQGGLTAEYMFSPAEMSLGVGDAQGNVFELTDALTAGLPYGFENYRVRLKVEAASGEGRVNIYSLCGYDCVTRAMYDRSEFAPSVYVRADTYAFAGETFSLPLPKASVLGGERVSDISAVVYENGEERAKGAVPGELSETVFTQPGTAEIVYTVTAASGKKTEVTLRLSVLEEGDVYNTFLPDGNCEDITVGTNTEWILPCVVNTSTFNAAETARYPSLVRVTDREGNALDGWDGTESGRGQTVRFTKSGEYTVSFADRSGKGNALSFRVTVTDDLPGLDGVEVREFYECDSEYVLQPADIYYKGECREAAVKAFAPDGTGYDSDFVFTMGGIYRIIYSAWFGEEEKAVELSLTVYERADGSFSCRTSSVAYKMLEEGNSGVSVSASMDEDVVFERRINLSQAKVNTEYMTTEPNGEETFLHIRDRDPSGSWCLIDFNVVNSDPAALDFSQVLIRVRDANDEENYFEVRIADGAFAGAAGMSYIRARAAGQSFSGLEVSNGKYAQEGKEELKVTRDGFNISGGYLLSYGFQQAGSRHERGESVRIYYDNDEKALFAVSGTQWGTLICDFDDPRFSAQPWEGFSSEEAIVEIRLGGISNTAEVIVYSIGEYDLTGEYLTDDEAPLLILDKAAASETYALIGEPFPLFSAESSDKSWSEVVAEVYLGSEKLPVENGCFVPEKPAVYTLVYYARDAFGNRSAPQYIFVSAQSAKTGISLSAEGKQTQALLGRTYFLPDYQVTGASGRISEFFGYRLKGESAFLPVTGGRIDFPAAGTYEILYKVTDYLSQTAEDFYEVVVSVTDEPVIGGDFSFYSLMFAGEGFSYEIPAMPAYVYGTDEVVQAEETVRILDGETEIARLRPGEFWTPDTALSGKALTAIYSVEGTSGTYTYPFVVRQREEGDKSAYFFWDDSVTVSQTTSSQPTFTMTEDGGFTFAKELLANNFGVTFRVSEGDGAFSFIRLTLTDSRTPSERVSVVFRRQTGGIVCSLDGAVWYDCPDDWASAAGLKIGYSSDEGRFLDSMGAGIGIPSLTADGKPFSGFSGGKVYFTLEVSGVTSAVTVCITEINNQQMGMSADRVAPEFFISGSYPGYDLGETVAVLPAVADDVLYQATAPVVSVYTGTERNPVYVRDSEGLELKEVPADRIYYFSADEYGMYTIAYSCEDTSARNNRRTEEVQILIQDKQPPEAELVQSVLRVASGDRVNLRELVRVADNITPENELIVTISVRKNRVREYVRDDGTYVFEESGEYFVDYLVRDGVGNLSICTLTVSVGG